MKVIDLCSGTGAFSYVFKKHGLECVFSNDMIKESKDIYQLNMKSDMNAFVLDNIHNIKTENIPSHDILCAGFPCFVAGTSVLTLDGYKNIETIDMTDSLMTHTGSFQRILNLQGKSYTGTMYKIVAKYHSPIECTSEHPFYVRERSRLWNNTKRKYDYTFGDPEWKKACELNDTHYFGMKVNQRSIVPEFSFERAINQTSTKKYNVVLDDPNAWFMMGFFVGDGWIEETCKADGRSMNKIRFAINSNDAETVLHRITSILSITDKQCLSGNSCNKYGCCDFVWFNIFKKFGRHAHGKRIPEWVQDAPVEFVREFLSGYIASDGNITESGAHTFTTVSENLALGVQRLYLKLGHLFSVKKDILPKTTVIQGRTVNQRDTYQVRRCVESSRRYSSFIEGEYVWYAPFKIETSSVENVPVYNFEVEHDNSYVVENLIVHNCQAFSIAGERKGFDDERSNVFWKITNILEFHKPRIIILENVKNLLSHDKGNTFKIIKDNLENIGYHIKYDILDTCKITNIPHHRERIYIVGFLDESLNDAFNFNFEHVSNNKINSFLEDNININEKYYYTDKLKVYDEIKKNIVKHVNTDTIYQYRRYYVRENKNKCCPTLTANMGSGGHNVPLIKDDNGIRKLTPRECFNFQGFPENYQLPDNLSDSKLYKLAGNAVSVPVIEKIILKIMDILS